MSDIANNREQELQRNAEKNLFNVADKDSRAYRLVFDAIRQEIVFQLPPRFSEAVLDRLESKEDRVQYYWFFTVIISFMVAAGVSIVLTGFTPDFGFLRNISKFTGLFAFGAAFILLLQWVDTKVVRRNSADI